jgi:parallel beta-helix repeat protein
MKLKVLLPLLITVTCLVFNTVAASPPVALQNGMLIKTSVQIRKNSYQLNGSDSLKKPVITIEGNNITVDFNNAVLQGSNDKTYPNEFYGLAILIKGNNVTLKNAQVSGYKVAVMARGCKNLKIEYCDFSYNYRQQLQSTWLSEDVSDWMSYHHNENDEWLRYGAGIYLKDCSNAVIERNRITGGQCALMMTRCNDGLIVNNDFSYNSGLGVGMYRSSRNKVINNRLVFNVRGYSDGIFNRGQDSAGILVFEQCNDNTFSYNNVTYGGDGFFLWAGQTSMDSGEGGCNGNFLYKNDFSYAPTNGAELTFSSNEIRENIIKECDNGIWGGYSFNTAIENNDISNNRVGIAIEHGQDNQILWNKFSGNKTAISIWANKIEPSDWGYPQKKDTKSRNYYLIGNEFSNNIKLMKIVNSDTVNICEVPDTLKSQLIFDSTVKELSITACDIASSAGYFEKLKRTDTEAMKYRRQFNPFAKLPTNPGRNNIHITEWGPYNFEYPLIFLKKIDSNNIYHFDILGAGGNWKIKNTNDVTSISGINGSFPEEITAQKTGDDVLIEMEYSGAAFTDQLGKKQTSSPYSFSYRDYKPVIEWNVNWFSWDAAHNPNKDYTVFKDFINASIPIKTEHTKQINYTWWGAIGKQLPADSFATVATATIDVKPGTYRIGITADDLVKVYIDGKIVIDFWDATRYVNDEDAHHSAIVSLNGKHNIRIEHVENAGYATLIFSLKPL